MDATGVATIAEDSVDNNSTDACGNLSFDTDVTDFDCSSVSPVTVTLTVSDNSGNTATCTSSVSIEDNVAPVAVCKDITVQLDATGVATIAEDSVNNNSTDACANLTFDTDITSFDCSSVSPVTVTLTVSDNSGNTATCTSEVTLEDNVAPVAVCKDITVQLDATGVATIAEDSVNNNSTDACANLTFDTDITSFDCSSVSPVTVTLTVSDNSGNTATCTSEVTLEDNVAPVAVCKDITVQLDATGVATIAEDSVNNNSTDACANLTFDTDITSFDCSSVSPVTVTLTVSDNSGNTATCTSEVTLEDNVAPVAVCKDITVQLDATGVATIAEDSVDNNSTDACGNLSFDTDVTDFDCSSVSPVTVTLTVSDNSGNTATCTSSVSIEDNVAPVAVCKDITVQLDATGVATIAEDSV